MGRPADDGVRGVAQSDGSVAAPARDRHAIVEIRTGALGGERVILRPGATLHVGRGARETRQAGARTEVSIPDDPAISEAHFAIAWDGATGTLVSSGATGTLLDGHRTERGEWKHGAWIRAGSTDFMVLVEGRTRVPLSRGPRGDAAVVASARSQIEAVARTGRLFGVLDAARDRRISTLVRESIDEQRCLYEGVCRDTMAAVAPYLVRFAEGSRLLSTVIDEGWGRSWGVFLTSSQPLRGVASALGALVQVETDFAPGKMFFRFYDPRVLREILPLSDRAQLREFFRAADAYLVEDKEGALRAHTETRPEGALLRAGTAESPAMTSGAAPAISASRGGGAP